MSDENSNKTPGGSTITQFPTRAFDLTPSDSTEYPLGIAVYVGGEGDVAVEPLHGGNTVTFTAKAGEILPVTCKRVLATNTTATSLKGVY